MIESVGCGRYGQSSSRIDGEPVAATPAGDLTAAVRQLREDAALLDAREIDETAFGITSNQI